MSEKFSKLPPEERSALKQNLKKDKRLSNEEEDALHKHIEANPDKVGLDYQEQLVPEKNPLPDTKNPTDNEWGTLRLSTLRANKISKKLDEVGEDTMFQLETNNEKILALIMNNPIAEKKWKQLEALKEYEEELESEFSENNKNLENLNKDAEKNKDSIEVCQELKKEIEKQLEENEVQQTNLLKWFNDLENKTRWQETSKTVSVEDVQDGFSFN